MFGIITGLKICYFSNTCIVWMVWGDHIKSFSTIFQHMLNYCRKFQNVKWHCKVHAFFWGHTVLSKLRIIELQPLMYLFESTELSDERRSITAIELYWKKFREINAIYVTPYFCKRFFKLFQVFKVALSYHWIISNPNQSSLVVLFYKFLRIISRSGG